MGRRSSVPTNLFSVVSETKSRTGWAPSDPRPSDDTARLRRQIEVRRFFHLPEKDRRPDVESRADIEDRAQGRVGLSKFDQTDESSLVPGFRGQGILAHLLLRPPLPQQLAKSDRRISPRIGCP